MVDDGDHDDDGNAADQQRRPQQRERPRWFTKSPLPTDQVMLER